MGSVIVTSSSSNPPLSFVASLQPAGTERKSLVAALQFVLESASRFGIEEEEHLRAELQQLGLPREHAAALARVHTETGRDIRQRLLDSSLMGESKVTRPYSVSLIMKLQANPWRPSPKALGSLRSSSCDSTALLWIYNGITLLRSSYSVLGWTLVIKDVKKETRGHLMAERYKKKAATCA